MLLRNLRIVASLSREKPSRGRKGRRGDQPQAKKLACYSRAGEIPSSAPGMPASRRDGGERRCPRRGESGSVRRAGLWGSVWWFVRGADWCRCARVARRRAGERARATRAASAHRTRNARKPQRTRSRSRSRRAASQRRSSPVFSRCFRRMAMRCLVDLVTIAGVHIVDSRGVASARAGTSGERRDSPLVDQQARRSAERCERSDRPGRLPRRETIGERSKLDRNAKSHDIGSLPRYRGRFSRSWSQTERARVFLKSVSERIIWPK